MCEGGSGEQGVRGHTRAGGPAFHMTSHRTWHITNGSQIFPEKSSFQFLCFSIMKCDPLACKALSWLISSSEIFRLLVY